MGIENYEQEEGSLDNSITAEDAEKINEIGDIDTHIASAESALMLTIDEQLRNDAQKSLEEWQGHKKEALSFAMEKIRNLENADKILSLANKNDIALIEEYTKQTDALVEQGVPNSLMTPEEKQAYYEASGRKNDFINFLRDNYNIEEDAAKEIYQRAAFFESAEDSPL